MSEPKVFAVKGKRKTDPGKPLLTIGDWTVYDERIGLHIAHRPKEGIATYTLYIPWSKIQMALNRHRRAGKEQEK
jgi:hypothetical protein